MLHHDAQWLHRGGVPVARQQLDRSAPAQTAAARDCLHAQHAREFVECVTWRGIQAVAKDDEIIWTLRNCKTCSNFSCNFPRGVCA